jgi:ABC-type Fe3+/spermidine/putrescine transport system ATPase subunit
MTAAALSLAGEGLRRSYRRGSFALDVPNIEVPAGTVLALLGPSGSGKSTLLSVLGLLERPSAGRVLLDGREVRMGDRAAQLQMAAVFQRPYLFKGTVGGNVSYGLVARRIEAKSSVSCRFSMRAWWPRCSSGSALRAASGAARWSCPGARPSASRWPVHSW